MSAGKVWAADRGRDTGTVDIGTEDGGTSDRGTADWGTGDIGTGDRSTGDTCTWGKGTGDRGSGGRGTGHRGTGDRGTWVIGTGDRGTGGEDTGDPGIETEITFFARYGLSHFKNPSLPHFFFLTRMANSFDSLRRALSFIVVIGLSLVITSITFCRLQRTFS